MLSEKAKLERLSKLVFWMTNIKGTRFRWAQDAHDMWAKASWPVPLPSDETVMTARGIISCGMSLRSLLERKANGRDIEAVQVQHARDVLNRQLKPYGLKAVNDSGLVTRLYRLHDDKNEIELLELA